MSQPPLTPGKASLLMLGIGTLALMGVPGVGFEQAPEGGITGRISAGGEALADAEVALFADEHPGLLEIAHTDSQGRYAFRSTPDRFHVFASRPEDPGWVGAWATDRRRTRRTVVNLRLQRGREVSAVVTDAQDRPLRNAELRVFDAGRGHVAVSRVLTDDSGSCPLSLPERAHVAVLAEGASGPAWWLEGSSDLEGDTLVLRLPEPRRLTGRALDSAGQGVGGLVISASDRSGGRWHGWTRTDAAGDFQLTVSDEPVAWRATDPQGMAAHGPDGAELEIRVEPPPSDDGSRKTAEGAPED